MRRLIFLILMLLACISLAQDSFVPIGVDTNSGWMWPPRTTGGTNSWNNVSREDTFIIRSTNDLIFTNGFYRLQDDATYEVNGLVSIGTNSILLGSNCVVEGAASYSDGLLYSGEDSLFVISNVNGTIRNLYFDTPSGTIFRVSGGISNQLQISGVRVNQAETIARVANYGRFFFEGNQAGNISSNGIAFSGAQYDQFVSRNNLFCSCVSSTVWNAFGTGVFNYVSIDNSFYGMQTNTMFITALSGSSNISSIGFGYISDINFQGGTRNWTNIVTGIQSDDLRWNLQSAQVVPISSSVGAMYLTNSSLVTILATGTWYPITNYWYQGITDRFEFQTNRLAYVGSSGVKVMLFANPTVSPALGSNQQMVMALGKNGVVYSQTSIAVTLSSGKYSAVPVSWVDELYYGDYIQLFVRNNTSVKNIVVQSADLVVKE